MKKTVVLILTAALALGLCACGGNPSSAQTDGSSAPTAQGGSSASASGYEVTDLMGRKVTIPAGASSLSLIHISWKSASTARWRSACAIRATLKRP